MSIRIGPFLFCGKTTNTINKHYLQTHTQFPYRSKIVIAEGWIGTPLREVPKQLPTPLTNFYFEHAKSILIKRHPITHLLLILPKQNKLKLYEKKSKWSWRGYDTHQFPNLSQTYPNFPNLGHPGWVESRGMVLFG